MSRYDYMVALDNEGSVPYFMEGFWGSATIAGGNVYDCVNISWGKSTPACILFDVTVIRYN